MGSLNRLVSQIERDDLRMSRRRLLQVVGVGSASGLLLAACGEDSDDDETPAEPDATNTPVESEAGDDPDDGDETAEPEGEADAESGSLEEYAQIVGPPVDDPLIPAVGTPRFGGDLQVASHDEPVTLDGHLNTRSVVQWLATMMCEGLFAWNLDSEPVPDLTESFEWNEDSTQLTIELRQGVLFHDGSELTSEDVQATVTRWVATSLGSDMAEIIESIDTPDDYTVVFNLTQSYPFLIPRLTVRQAATMWVYSKAQIDGLADPSDDIGVPIGTGPFQFDEWRENQFLRLTRFDDYVGRQEPPMGYAGGRVAYLDSVTFHWVLDEAVRIAGLQTGEYHFADNILQDHFARFENDPEVRTRLNLGTWPCVHFNLQQGPMSDLRLRQAWNAAVDITQVAAALGDERFFPLGPSLIPDPNTPWHSNEIGNDVYLEYDPEKARALLEESDYDGEPIRYLVNPDSAESYTPGIVMEPMLEEVGFNIELVSLDAATLASYRADPNRMDAFACSWGPRPDPTLMAAWAEGFPGWWDTEEKKDLLERIRLERDFQTRVDLWHEFQELYYTQIPGIKISDQQTLVLESEKYSGARMDSISPAFINSWLNE